MSHPTPPRTLESRNRTVVLACLAFTAFMLGAAYASVPLYDLFCRITGFGGATTVADAAPSRAIDRAFEVRFDANVNGGLTWTFKPEAPAVEVKAGAVTTVYYTITNHSDRETWGIASYNVTPASTGAYFAKLQCFCFSEQRLGPRESRTIPVVFFVDPAIDEDADNDSVTTITLSYTFFAAEAPAKPVAAAAANSQL